MMQEMQQMTPEQAKEMLASMTPEEKAQAERMQKGMLDLSYLCGALKPDPESPDARLSDVKVVTALCGAPVLREQMERGWTQLGEKVDEAVLEKLEAAFVAEGSLEAGALSECEAAVRKNALMLYWHMHRSKMTELADSLPSELDALRSGANQLATQLLIKAQMLMPQQRWVQPTLAVGRLSALVSNGLHSHTDEGALEAMTRILQDPEAGGPLPYPKLKLAAHAKPRHGNGEEVVAGQHVLATVELTREHAAAQGDPQPECTNPQGLYEAYWVYVEGLKPEGTPNSLITAQPLAVKDLTQTVLTAEIPFMSPPTPGTYALRVHVLSTSVIGVDLTTDCSFTVVEDDVPDLE